MLQKTATNISFAQGLDTKTDPFQIPIGKFQALQNTVFTKGGLLQKRNGFGYVKAGNQPATATQLSIYRNTLVALGNELSDYDTTSANWIGKGQINPVNLSTASLVRNPSTQPQADSATAPNGAVCVVYTQQNGATTTYWYSLVNGVTGETILGPFPIGNADPVYGTPRVYILGAFFFILYASSVSGSTGSLVYTAFSYAPLNNALHTGTITTAYSPSSIGIAFDAVNLNGLLYVSWNGSGSSGIKLCTVSNNLTVGGTIIVDGSHTGTTLSVCQDIPDQQVWVSYYDQVSTKLGYAAQINPPAVPGGNPMVVSGFPVQIINGNTVGVSISNLVSDASGGTANFFYSYSVFNSTLNYFFTQIGYAQAFGLIVSSGGTFYNGVGVASKPFMMNGNNYILSIFTTTYQSTYFLLTITHTDAQVQVVAKLAYGNGPSQILGLATTPILCPCAVSVNGSIVQIPYLYQDLIAPVSKVTNPDGSVSATTQVNGPQTVGVYSQLGVNLVTFNFNYQINSVEIGADLNISGGLVNSYDGILPTENNFHAWPEPVTAAAQTDPSFSGTTHIGTFLVTVASTANLGVGMSAVSTLVATGSIISEIISATQFIYTNPTQTPAVTTATASFTFSGSQSLSTSKTPPIQYWYQVTYEWTDNQGNAFRSAPSIPVMVETASGTSSVVITLATLKVTAKPLSIENPSSVKACVYRWSTDQQVYYQVTSIQFPLLMGVSSDFVTFVDGQSDEDILGNAILYTTGGVIEDIGPPASKDVFLFDDRMWLIDAEDPNLLWFSKQVIEATPVEMSDLLTFYVAPSLGAQGSAQPLTCAFPLDDKCILFKGSSILWFNGTGPDNTGSNSQYSTPLVITTTVGCSNPLSIVLTPMGLIFEFKSPTGSQLWALNHDLSTQYIGAPVENFLKNSTVTSAVNIPGSNQVRFALSSGVTVFYDYYYEQWGTFINVPSISGVLWNGLHTYLDQYGGIYQETPGVYLDGSKPVLIGLTTGWLNLSGLQGYQRAFFFYLLGLYYSPFKLAYSIAYDYDPQPIQQNVIQPTNENPTYGGGGVYGQQSPYGGNSNNFNWRIFLTKHRCSSFQITLSEMYDPSFGQAPGQGLSLSGINLVYAFKKGFRTISTTHTSGGNT